MLVHTAAVSTLENKSLSNFRSCLIPTALGFSLADSGSDTRFDPCWLWECLAALISDLILMLCIDLVSHIPVVCESSPSHRMFALFCLSRSEHRMHILPPYDIRLHWRMQWFLNKSDQELGPFFFKNLVQMVRDGNLAPGDMVRPDYLQEWQRADSVVGLFHMATRDDVPIGSSGPTQAELEAYALDDDPDLIDFCDEDETDEEPTGEDLPQPSQKPRWIQRLIYIRGKQAKEAKGTAAATSVSSDENFHGYSKSLWSQVIGSATGKVDSKLNPKRGFFSKLGGLISFCFSPRMLRIGFRLAAAIGCANLASYWVVNWTDNEALRFPSHNPQDAKQIFPLLGECTSFEYSMYVFDFMIVVGVLTFFAAYWIESYADD